MPENRPDLATEPHHVPALSKETLTMRLRSLAFTAVAAGVFTAVAAGCLLSATTPAFADRDFRGGRDGHADRGRRDWHGGHVPPPVVVAPPPASYGYYAPPPVAFGQPGVSIGINIP
jgi:hypothetical protein